MKGFPTQHSTVFPTPRFPGGVFEQQGWHTGAPVFTGCGREEMLSGHPAKIPSGVRFEERWSPSGIIQGASIETSLLIVVGQSFRYIGNGTREPGHQYFLLRYYLLRRLLEHPSICKKPAASGSAATLLVRE